MGDMETPEYPGRKLGRLIDNQPNTRLGDSRLRRVREWAATNLPEAGMDRLEREHPRLAKGK
ncbi:MAG: hypothetical protein UV80_C0002G0245 [Candidatus Peregrinibacteria bacterium GW2011_GWF2_43_17]|nr:MAG: hypothetical protein UV80_C0002G0245 [Candidatus Peregrinibacteria bacterium GW2011_GWF2_43_17]HAU39714.1 hypothetical protein [Candidatus Peregrinibacteria bacterium]